MTENGILAQVPGQFIAQASQTLPTAGTAEDRDYHAEIEAGHAGLVRVTFRRQKARRNKTTHWFWSARRADQV